MITLDEKTLKELKEEKEEIYCNLNKSDHDMLVGFGIKIIDSLLQGIEMNLQLYSQSEFMSYIIQSDYMQVATNLDYIRSVLEKPSVEVMIDPERRKAYCDEHRYLLALLAQDLAKGVITTVPINQ